MAQTKARSAQKKTNTSGPRGKKPQAARKPVRREVGAVVCLFVGLFTAIGYFVEGYWLIDALCLYVFKGLFGWGFWLIPPAMLTASFLLFFHKGKPVTARLVAVFLMPLLFGAAVHMISCGAEYAMQATTPAQYYTTGIALESGGVLSGYLSELLRQAVSAYGALPLLIFLMMVCVLVAGDVSLKKLFTREPRAAYEPEPEPEPRQISASGAGLPQVFERRREKRREEKAIDIPVDEEEPQPAPAAVPAAAAAEERETEDIPAMPRGSAALNKLAAGRAADKLLAEMTAEEAEGGAVAVPEPVTAEIADPPRAAAVPAPAKSERATSGDIGAAAAQVTREIEDARTPPEYTYPPLTLLNPGKACKVDGREEVNLNRERLESTLKSFGIGATITGVIRGPTVTRYDLELDAGLRLTKLTNLAGDLALSLGVVSVRIAPIPDKISTVGVEVPNKLVSTVYLREVVASAAFQNAQSKLSFAIGKDISGNCIVGNVSKLPHMLIAGTTGSGKSVCINCLILSLLYKATPEEVRLIMIDPKMVELGIYNGIPHLYIPVVTDPKKAAGALQWSVVEMMKRYRLFSEIGVRDLPGYNHYQKANGGETLPNLVIVIDELADLMMTAAKEVEESICRVAQMGRAAGVHLVIATQRPSADVITGLMKANIPSRIAFAVSSALESRIIMDQQGAEKLIGMGDMLYSPIGCGKPLRIQGAFVSDEEREDVISFIKEGGEANYDQNAMVDIEKAAAEKDKDKSAPAGEDEGGEAGEENPFADFDELLPQAVDVILDTKQASVSMLQRRLKLGYSRAARLVDQMEELGVVGPFEGSKPRQILISRQQWQEMSLSGRTPLEKLMDEQKDDFSEERN